MALDDGFTPLSLAAQGGHVDVVQMLLRHGADKQTAAADQRTPLFIACQQGHLAVVTELLAAEVDPDWPRDDGCTPLNLAAHAGHVRITKALLEAGADKNTTTKDGITALFSAAQFGHSEIVTLLLEEGYRGRNHGALAVVVGVGAGAAAGGAMARRGSMQPLTGLLGLHKTAMRAVMSFLSLAGTKADTEITDLRLTSTPLIMAAMRGRSEIVQLLLEAGADKVVVSP
jgi:ankyrin repeat protein